MKDLLPELQRLRAAGRRVAVARVVSIEGSAPREPGAAMAVVDDGTVLGSVSGGCVEGAVVTEALAVLAGEAAPRVISFGYSDDDAFAVGLTCGGTVHLLVSDLDAIGGDVLDAWAEAAAAGDPVAVVSVMAGPPHLTPGRSMLVFADGRPPVGTLGEAELDRVAARDALGELEAARSGPRHYGVHGEARRGDVTLFVDSYAAPPRMVVIGAVDFTAALARAAKTLGYHVTVCDARPVFATTARFPMADEVVVSWPDAYLSGSGSGLGPRDAICVLTHDPKFDVPALQAALATRAGYIGAMGSRRTHAERTAKLREVGVNDADLDRVMGPIGLDIGARTPEEVAVSICAEIIALRTGRAAPSLRDTSGSLH